MGHPCCDWTFEGRSTWYCHAEASTAAAIADGYSIGYVSLAPSCSDTCKAMMLLLLQSGAYSFCHCCQQLFLQHRLQIVMQAQDGHV